MTGPEGKLTPAQFEIMQIVWDADDGLTVAEIWEAVSASRDVKRTTILNLVDRLENRGWLKRRKKGGVFRYKAAVNSKTTSAQVAAEFVDDFFGGSTTDLVMSLLGSKTMSRSEVQRLRELLEDHTSRQSKRKGQSS